MSEFEIKMREELKLVAAQLRHAYTHLHAERVREQREFANGLISPQIQRIEKILAEMESGMGPPDRPVL